MYRTLIKKDYLLCGDTLTGILLIGALISCGIYLMEPANALGLFIATIDVYKRQPVRPDMRQIL